MISHCLRVGEYKEIVAVNFFGAKKNGDLEYLEELYDSCKYWDNKIVGINYFFSLALESLQKQFNIEPSVIQFIYELEDTANFKIEEIEISFIEHLYQTFDPGTGSIEDKLIEVQNFIDG